MQLALSACGVGADDKVLVALSGGADSTALLVLMHDALKEGRIGGLSAAHFHHGLRGAEADRDAAFCERLCASLGIPFLEERADVAAAAAERGESIETAARVLRYDFLTRAADQMGADLIATAHNRDDQAETVLMHLIRGSGTDGLAGIHPVSGRLIRPLLGESHGDLKAMLVSRGIAWCEDSTNAQADAMRNRVRLELMPLLKTYNPRITEGLSKTASLVRADMEALDALAADLLKGAELDGGYDRKRLASAEEAVRRRAVKRLLEGMHLPEGLTGADVNRVDAMLTAQSGTAIELRGGNTAFCDGPVLRVGLIEKQESWSVPLQVPGTTEFPGGRVVTEEAAFRLPKDGSEAFIDLGALPAGAVLRTRCAGDRFHPLGGPGMRLLSDVLTDRHIPPGKRDIPLIADGEEVLWVPGYTVSERLRVTSRTKRVLYIQLFMNEKGASII